MKTKKIAVEMKEQKNRGYKVFKIGDKVYWSTYKHTILYPMAVSEEEFENKEDICRDNIRMDCLLNIHDEMENVLEELDNYKTHENIDFYTEVCATVNNDEKQNVPLEKRKIKAFEKKSPNGIFRIIALEDNTEECSLNFYWEDCAHRHLNFIIGQELDTNSEEKFNAYEEYLVNEILRECKVKLDEIEYKIENEIADAYTYDDKEMYERVYNEILEEGI